MVNNIKMYLFRNHELSFNSQYSKFFSSLTLLALFLAVIGTAKAVENTPELVVFNWSEYIDPEMVRAFEKKYSVNVKELYFESDDERDQLLLQSGGRGYDVIMANGATINSYIKRNWLQPVNSENVPNIKHIDETWFAAFPAARDYAVPYMWGTLGIAYRKDLVSKPLTSWMDLLRPEKELHGKILMVKSSRDVIGMALKALGYSLNSENSEELAQAEALLLEQKPHVARFGYIALDEESSMVKGSIAAATVYGGDAINVAEYNNNIVYVLPEEGGNIWVDYFVISKYSDKVDLAEKFLDFIHQPEWAARNSEELYLATTNAAAKKYLSPEILNDPVIYPDATLLSRSELYTDLSPRALRKRALIFARFLK